MPLLYRFLRPYRWVLVLALFLAAINQVFSLLDPQVFRIIVDRYGTKAGTMPPREFILGVSGWVLLAVGAAFVSRVAKNFQDYYLNVVTQRVSTQLYEHAIHHSFSLPFASFEDQRSGELLQKLQKARSDVQLLIANFVNVFFISGVGMLFVFTYAFIVNWLVGVAYMAVVPLLGFVTFLLTRRIRGLQQKIIAQTADLAGSTTETLRNVELVKSLGLEEQEVSRLNTVNQEILRLELNKIRAVRVLSFLQGTVVNATRAALLLLLWYLVGTQQISLGQLFSLLFYSFFIFGPLAELGNVSAQYQEARASLEQLEAILNLPPEPKPDPAIDPGVLTHVAFERVNFSYSADAPVLRDISLEVRSGESIAFVGPSGSGKSTLVKLLVGLYHRDNGSIIFNGVDSETVDFDLLRQRIGFVSQETQLFAGTIRDNLLFVRPQATEAEQLAAIAAAAASSIIQRDSAGLDTRIGEGGIRISGGERQRLAIARALLRDPQMLIFDEATSSLDSLTEREITQTIKRIAETRPSLMCVLVTHRLSTIAHADRIYVLERGRIIEQGSHAQLLAEQDGLYAALWRQQSAEGSAEREAELVGVG
jgi:ATP-binding cassette, subfamily B, bacterial